MVSILIILLKVVIRKDVVKKYKTFSTRFYLVGLGKEAL
jgi:hypothetical protein